MSRFIRVNMRSKKVEEVPVPSQYRLLGGVGLVAQVMQDEVDPACEPLGPKNKLIVAPGLLAGTNASSVSRLSYGAKSPLTGGIKEANAGGDNGRYLARLGIKAVIIEDCDPDDRLYVLFLGAKKTELVPAEELKGKGVYETAAILLNKYDKVGVACIGPAGEYLLSGAGIANTDRNGNPERFAARGGLGAVMGSKGLKAIVIENVHSQYPIIQNPEAFKAAMKKYNHGIKNHPSTGKGLATWGTMGLVDPINAAGDIPVKNFSRGQWENCGNINASKLVSIIEKRGCGQMGHGCQTACLIRCSNQYPGKEGRVVCKLDYETASLMGPNLLIDDLDMIASLNRKCNDVGLDTMETGVALGVAMEAGVVSWGDTSRALELLEEVAQGTPLGRVIGMGARTTGKVFGVRRIPAAKGQAFAGYDPRASKGQGVTYFTSPLGADHCIGYLVGPEILKSKGLDLDPFETRGKTDVSEAFQIYSSAIDSLGVCTMATNATTVDRECTAGLVEMVNAMYGTSFTPDTFFRELGIPVLRNELEFNRRAGFTTVDNLPPEFVVNEPLPPHNVRFDVPIEEMNRIFTDL